MNEPILMKSKERVQKHGEVFTPDWVIEKMVAIPGIKEKTEDIFATFLEPSAGEGAFLLAIQDLKLKAVSSNYDKKTWDRYALWALTSIYGIEYLDDNLETARRGMLNLFLDYYDSVFDTPLSKEADFCRSVYPRENHFNRNRYRLDSGKRGSSRTNQNRLRIDTNPNSESRKTT